MPRRLFLCDFPPTSFARRDSPTRSLVHRRDGDVHDALWTRPLKCASHRAGEILGHGSIPQIPLDNTPLVCNTFTQHLQPVEAPSQPDISTLATLTANTLWHVDRQLTSPGVHIPFLTPPITASKQCRTLVATNLPWGVIRLLVLSVPALSQPTPTASSAVVHRGTTDVAACPCLVCQHCDANLPTFGTITSTEPAGATPGGPSMSPSNLPVRIFVGCAGLDCNRLVLRWWGSLADSSPFLQLSKPRGPRVTALFRF